MMTSDGRGEIIPPDPDSTPSEKAQDEAPHSDSNAPKKPGMDVRLILGITAGTAMILLICFLIAVALLNHLVRQLSPLAIAALGIVVSTIIVSFVILFFRVSRWMWRMATSGDEDEGHSDEKVESREEEIPAHKPQGVNPWRTVAFVVFLLALGTTVLCLSLSEGPIGVFHDITHPGSRKITSTVLPHPNFVPRRICDVTHTISYARQDLSSTHDTIKVTLVEGCYADWYLVPGSWNQYEVQLSHNAGDYVSLWCNNNPNPYNVLEQTDDVQGLLDREMNGCHAPGQWTNEFHFQGHGTITLIATSKRVSRPLGNDGYPAP